MAQNDWWKQGTSPVENSSGGEWWKTGTKPVEPEKPRTRGLFEAVNDNVIEFANAAAGGVSALANFVKPGNAVSGFIDENIIKAGEAKQSDVVQGAKRQLGEGLQNAQGIGDEVGAVGRYVLDNPLLAASQAAGSFALPGGAVKGAGAAAKALGAGAKGIETAGRVGGVAAGAAMAGGDAAGTAYDLASKAGATEDQALAAGRQASVIPALVGGVTGAFGAERLLAGAKGFGGNALSRGLKSGLSEAGQEAVEEGVTQFEGQRAAMPYDSTIDPTKGVAGAAAMGGIMGFGPGAVLGAIGDAKPSQQMGIDPGAGPLSRAAAASVDSQPVPQPLGASITGTAPADLMGRATDPLAEQITSGRQKSEDLAVTRNAFADRNSEALAGGGLFGSRADPLANMIADQRSSEASTAANIDRAAQNRAPMTATEAGNMLVAAREQGRDFTVAPHPDGGFVVVPRAWVMPQVAAKAESSLMETLGRVAQVEDAPINRAARVSTEPSNLNLNTDPVTGYVDNLRSVNTPAARMFVSEFDAGRITRRDVERRMAAERGKTADERIAEAAAQAKKPEDPYSLGNIAQSRPEQAPGPLIEIPRTNKLKEARNARRAADVLRGTRNSSSGAGADITDAGVANDVGSPDGATGAAAPVVPEQGQPSAGERPAADQAALRPDGWRTTAIKAGKVARSLGLDPKGKRLREIVAEIDAVDAGSGVAAKPVSREQAIRDAWRKEPRTIGKWTPISVEAEGQKADMLVNQKRAGGDKDGALHVVNIRMGKMLKDMEREPIAYTFRLTADNRLVEEGIPTVATPGQIAAWKGAGFTLDDKTANVQNTPSSTAGTEAQASPVEARAPEGGNAASDTGVPAAPGAGDVQADGVNLSKNPRELNTSAEPVQKTSKNEQVAQADGVKADENDDGIRVKEGKGGAKGMYFAIVDGESAPGGPWATPDIAQAAGEEWKRKTIQNAKDTKQERDRWNAIAESFKAGKEVTTAQIESLGLKAGTSDVRWFFPIAARLFDITSRDIRPLVKGLIRDSFTDMGAKREFVPTRKALEAVAADVVAGEKKAESTIKPSEMYRRLQQLSARANRKPYTPLTEEEFKAVVDAGLATGKKWATGKLNTEGYGRLAQLEADETKSSNARADAEDLIAEGLPFKASAVDQYGLSVPEGYVRQGEMFAKASPAAQAEKPAEQVNPEPSKAAQPKAEKPSEDDAFMGVEDQTQTEAFKKWFGDSKVVDDAGKPLRVFHGSRNAFTVFDYSRIGQQGRAEGAGFYFTNSKDVASGYGDPMEVFLSIKKPLAYDAKQFSKPVVEKIVRRVAELEAQAEGGDIADGFLSNFGDVRSEGLASVVRQAGGMIAADETALDQLSGIVGSGVNPEFVNLATRDVTGFDGVFAKGFSNAGDASNSIYVAFFPEQIKSATGNRGTFDPANPDITFMGVKDDAPIFYSSLRKEIEGLNLKSAPFLGWHGQLQGLVRAGKVKADELEWTGITEWLKLQTGKVSKDDVLAFLDANGVQVTETVLGDEARETAAERWMQERARLEFAMPFDSLDEADQDYIRGKAEDANIAPDRLTKYSQYTLPGGENYREVLLTLPIRSGGGLSGAALEEERFVRALKAKYGADVLDNEEASSRMTDEEANKLFRLSQATHAEFEAGDGYLGSSEIQSYESSHWDQKNVLAHIRVNDRTDAQGRKVLFVEEIQSDWGQDGKKKGFVDPARPYQVFDKRTGQTVAQFSEELDASRDSIKRGEGEFDYRDASGKTLAAPFIDKTDKWLALSLKRIIKMAVDEGYDRVAFVNGEQSAERYDLSRQISEINYEPAGEGLYEINAKDMSGKTVLDEDEVTLARIEELVGKEIAKKIEAGEGEKSESGYRDWRKLSGLDLKVGGEGMKAFYDKIVPAAVKDVLKKVGGGQMEGVGIAAVENGLTVRPIDSPFGKFVVVDGNGKQVGLYETESEAKAYMAQSAKPQPGFTITDSMREKVAGGLPLFAGTKDKAKRQGTPVDRAIMDMAGEGREANEILSFIAKSSKSPYRRQLAQKLLATGANPAVSLGGEMGGGAGFRFLAKYSRKNHEVTLSEAAADRAEQIFLHETVHAATLLALDKGGLIATQMRRLAASVYKDASPEMRKMYGLVLDKRTGEVNVGEFVAEAFTNPDFQKALKGMKADNGSLWDRLVNIVRRILGMEPRQQDALSKALELGAGVMRENIPLRAARSFRAEDWPAFAGIDQTETPEFKRWFAGSKVVDADGKPLRVFHGTPASFNAFKEGTGWFTADPGEANFWGGMKDEGANVIPAYLSIKNPRLIQASEASRDAIVDALSLLRGNQDGVLVMEDGRVRWAIVTEPTQIKSATGNNGNFDPEDADIAHFGIADAVEQIKAFDVKEAPKNTWAHYRGMALQALGRRQLVDLYGDEFGTHMHEYDSLVQQMDAEKNETGAEADDLAQRWSKLEEREMVGIGKAALPIGKPKYPGMDRKLAELMHDATLAQMDPDKPMPAGYSKAEYDRLKTRFNTLSPAAKDVYREARDMYVAHYKSVQQAIKDRIERSEMSSGQKRKLMADLDDKLFKELKGVYFPLSRFGQYVIVVKDANGEVKNVTRAETVKEAEQARKELQKAFPAHMGNTVGKVLKQAEFNAGRDAVGKGFMADLMNALDEKGVDDELRDTVAQLYLSSLPDLSWAKHGIHRKGTPGFSQDARRAFAQNAFHGARYLAKLRYSDRLQDELTGMQEYVKAFEGVEEYDSIQGQQVVDEMVKRHEILMNPKSSPVSTALTSFGFLFHMGLSPASAMVNLTQTALVAYPQMGAKWGFTKAGAALAKASEEVVRAKNDLSKSLKGEELAAFERAVKDGTIDVTMAHDLAGIAQGEDQGVMWKIRPVMRWASFMFHHAEKFNRQATFVAAYRLSKEANPEKPFDWHYEAAKKATYDGHFDYSAANRARIMQGNWQRVILLFKQYAQSMVYTLARNAYQSVKALDPKERSQARKTLGGILAAHAAAAGVLGLPIVGPLLTVASWIGGDDDEPWDAEVAMQNAMAEMIGPKAAEVVARGFSRLTPFDLSGRVALNKLILPDVQEGLEGKEWAESAMAAALGPVAGIGVNMARGAQKITEGDYMRGLEDMMPTALRGPLKAMRYANEGAVDKTGVTITEDVSAAGVLGQASGFSPSQVRRDTERRSAIYSYDRALLERRSVLMRMFAQAQMSGDLETAQEVRQDIQRFNEKNPTRRITPMNLAASIRNRRKRIEEAEQGVYLPSKRRDALEVVTF